MRKIVSVLLFPLLCSCGGAMVIMPRDGGGASEGSFDTLTKTMQIHANGKVYSGPYVTNASSSYSSGNAYSGTKSAFASGRTFHSGNSGVALLTASDGDSMRCEFQYDSMNGIGVCQDRAGRIFDFTTK